MIETNETVSKLLDSHQIETHVYEKHLEEAIRPSQSDKRSMLQPYPITDLKLLWSSIRSMGK